MPPPILRLPLFTSGFWLGSWALGVNVLVVTSALGCEPLYTGLTVALRHRKLTCKVGINGAQRAFFVEKIEIKGCSWLEVVSGERDIASEVSSG